MRKFHRLAQVNNRSQALEVNDSKKACIEKRTEVLLVYCPSVGKASKLSTSAYKKHLMEKK